MPQSEPGITSHTKPDTPLDKANQSRTHASSGRGDSPKSSAVWLNGGTWRRGSKATPVTQVAKESILAATEKTSGLIATVHKANPCAAASSQTYTSEDLSQRTNGLKAQWANNIPADRGSTLSELSGDLNKSSTLCHRADPASAQNNLPAITHESQHEKPFANAKSSLDVEGEATPMTPEARQSNAGMEISPWYSWFFRYGESHKVEPLVSLGGMTQVTASDLERPNTQRRNSDPGLDTTNSETEAPPRSWLGWWGAKRLDTTDPVHAATSVDLPSLNVPRCISEATEPALDRESELFVAQPKDTTRNAWTFWSREVPRYAQDETGVTKEGMAPDGSAEQPRPKRAKLEQVNKLQARRPHSIESPRKAIDLASQHLQPRSEFPPKVGDFPKRADSTKKTSLAKGGAQNLVDGYHIKDPIVKTTSNFFMTRLVSSELSQSDCGAILSVRVCFYENFLSHSDNCEQYMVQRFLIHLQGVHGYFPAPFIRSVLGQPTGTSIKFADGAAQAIRQWNDIHGYSCEIEKVALEGEGKILERVGLLWDLLLNWLDIIRRADFVMIACHSQGVPVALMLIAKLIEFGCVRDARIGVCAMAGVNLGPFLEYKSRWIGGSAGELFEFARPESRVSKDYSTALETSLKFGVKVCYVGSIDDQLVSLDSSTFGPIDHPHIYRAVFVDGRVHAPDFLTNLVGFAFKLRNLGISDHGLIRELSQPLAGSLYSGEGHSKIYEDNAVYYLAVQNALQTSTLGERTLHRERESVVATQNPYILPFSLRGVLEENFVRTELRKETAELLEQFDHWKPSSKVLKDVKFRLEGIRSKL
ncbi:MAG: hypothetical protein Q9220_007740 [cf. Caloplaca sp. 1 TL-2023]